MRTPPPRNSYTFIPQRDTTLTETPSLSSVEKEVADGEVSAQEVELQSIEAGAEVEADQTVTTQ